MPDGILPAADYLRDVANYYPGVQRFWFAPTLLWLGAGNHALMLITWVGLIASVAVIFNLWPRLSLTICLVCFLSFVAAAQDFSGFQSDGMLLEAGFISLFFAPAGLRPRLGAAHAPSRLSLFLLRWEWFRIYFESGIVKLTSGDYSWRHLTAMDDYYQNGPLPTWIGWYVQQLPHWFHAATAFMTLAAELGLVWMLFLPRRFRILCFLIVTPFQIRHHPHRKLHVSQLPRPGAGLSAARRRLCPLGAATALEELGQARFNEIASRRSLAISRCYVASSGVA